MATLSPTPLSIDTSSTPPSKKAVDPAFPHLSDPAHDAAGGGVVNGAGGGGEWRVEMTEPDVGIGDNADESTISMVAKLRDIIATSNGLLTDSGGMESPPATNASAPVFDSPRDSSVPSEVATKTEQTALRSDCDERTDDQSLSAQKNTLISYIQDQIQNLSIRSNILRFKYDGYKKWFDGFSIAILFLSASLTFLEAMRARISVGTECDDTPEHVTAMNMIPIAIGSTLTILSAIIKFNKYHVKMEKIERAIQKAIFTSYRLKRTQENVKHLKSVVELNDALQVYSAEPYDMYIQSCEEMENNLKYEDMVVHMQTYYDLSIECKRSEMEYRLKRLLLGATEQLRESGVTEDAVVYVNHARNYRRGYLRAAFENCCKRTAQCICPLAQAPRTRQGD